MDGDKQGGALSPCLFSVDINLSIENIRNIGVGYRRGNLIPNVFVYADLIILGPAVTALQKNRQQVKFVDKDFDSSLIEINVIC